MADTSVNVTAAAAAEAADSSSVAPQEGIEGISVAVRVRPLNSRETKSGWRALPQYNAIAQLGADGEPLQGSHAVFNVDRVFDETATTKELYTSVCSKVVSSAVNGINGTIFAYGQTSSGKTHTMQGGGDSVGVLQLAAEEIFSLIEASSGREYLLKVAFMEIYNENLRDLLSADGDAAVQIREDPKKGVYIECKEEVINGFADIQACLRRGEQHRVVASTAMNERSSRSHAIFRLTIESSSQNEHGETSQTIAALNLVDLAGSESVRNTGATGQRAKEGGKINQSLLTLSRVIQQLGEGGGHVNFRDSKLTRLLQPMLQGNACMAMITCVTPAEQFAEETRSTLQFACRAKSVRLNPEINEVLDKDSQLKKLRREVAELKEKARQTSSPASNTSDNSAEILAALAEKDRLVGRLGDAETMLAKYEMIIKAEVTGETSVIFSEGNDLDESFADGGGLRRHLHGAADKRSKRQRETWCPGERGVPMPEFLGAALSPSGNQRLANRRRLSGGGVCLEDSCEASSSGSSAGGANFQVPALEAMLEKRTEELHERESEMEAMYSSLDTAEQDAAAARQELAVLQEASAAEIAALKQQLGEAASASAGDAAPSGNSSEEVEALKGRISELEADLFETSQLYNELEKDQLDLVAEKKAKATLDAETIGALQGKLAEAGSDGKNGSEEEVARLSAEVKALREELASTKMTVEANEAAKMLEVNALTVDKQGLIEDLEECQEKLAEVSVAADEAALAQDEAQAVHATELAVQASRIAELEEQLAGADPEYTTELEGRVQTLTTQLEEKAAVVTEVEARLSSELASQATAAAVAAGSAQATSEEMSALKAELVTVAAQLNQFKATMESTSKEAEVAFASQLAAKDAELEAFAAKAGLAQESLGDKVLAAQASLAAKDTELEAAVATLAAVQEAAEAAAATSAAKAGDEASTAAATSANDEKVAELTAQVGALEAEKAALVEQHALAVGKAVENEAEHGKEVAALSAELSNLADELMAKDEAMSKAVEAATAESAEALAAAQGECQTAQAAAVEAAAALADAQQSLAAHQAENAAVALVTQELEEAKGEVEELKQQLTNDMRLKETSKQNEASAERNGSELNKLRGELTAANVEIKTLREQCEGLETELRCLKETAEGTLQAQQASGEALSSKKVSQQAAQIQILTAELATCKHKLGEAEAHLAKASGSFDKKYEKSQQEIGAMSAKLATFDEVSLRSRNLEQAMAATEARATKARESCATAEQQAKAAADVADKATAEAETLRAKLSQMEGAGGAASEIERLQQTEQELDAKAKLLETDLRGTEARLKKARQENEMLREECGRVGELQQQLEAATAAASEAAAGAADPEYTTELEGRVETLTAQLEEKAAEATGLEARVEELVVEVGGMEEMSQQCMALEESNMDMETKLTAAHRAAAVASEQHKAAVDGCAMAQAAAATAEASLSQVTASHAKAVEERNELVEEMSQLAAKFERMVEKASGLTKELGIMDAAVTTAERAASAARAEAAAAVASNSTMQGGASAAEVAALEASVKDAKASETKLRTELSRLKDDLHEKQKEFEAEFKVKDARIAELDKVKFTTDLQEKFQKLIKDKNTSKSVVKRLTAELDGLREQKEAGGAAAASSAADEAAIARAEAALAGVKVQLEEEKEKFDKIETKLRKFVAYTKNMESAVSAAKRALHIMRVALKLPEPAAVANKENGGRGAAAADDGAEVEDKCAGIVDLPALALDLCKRLSEEEDVAALASGLESVVGRLREEKSSALDAQAEAEGKLQGLRGKEAELVRQAEASRKAVVEAEARAREAEQSQGQNSQELAAKLHEKQRDVKFLENENLQLMLEVKDVKKQAAAAKAELEALQRQQAKRSSPGSLSLVPGPAAAIAAPPASAALLGGTKALGTSSSVVLGDHKENTSLDSHTNSISAKQGRRSGGAPLAPTTTTSVHPQAVPNPLLARPATNAADENPAECKQS